jgi:hypothetical protein
MMEYWSNVFCKIHYSCSTRHGGYAIYPCGPKRAGTQSNNPSRLDRRAGIQTIQPAIGGLAIQQYMKSKNLFLPILLMTFLLAFLSPACLDDPETDDCPDPDVADFSWSPPTPMSFPGLPATVTFSRENQAILGAVTWDPEDGLIQAGQGTGNCVIELQEREDPYDITLEVGGADFLCTRTKSVYVDANFPEGSSALIISSGEGNVFFQYVDEADENAYDIADQNAPSGSEVNGVTFDADTRKVYYSSSVWRCNPNGSELEKVVDEEGKGGIATDGADNRLVYCRRDPIEQIYALALCDLDGKELDFLHSSSSPVNYMTMNKDENLLFFVDPGLDYFVKTGPWDQGLDPLEYCELGGYDPIYALIYDHAMGYLYYARGYSGEGVSLFKAKAPVTANSVGELVLENASFEPILGLAVDEPNQMLYWTDQEDNTVKRLDLKDPNAEPEIVAHDVSNPRALAVIY